ncbi:MAG: autotransporter outer membrane beta-barrel domain-containing protein [Pseudomonadota bacterium]
MPENRNNSSNRILNGLRAFGLGAALSIISGLGTMTAQSVVITERNLETQELEFVGAVVDRDGSFVAVNQGNLTGIAVTDYATTTTIPFEGSVLGVPQAIGGPVTLVPPGSRAGTVEDAFLNSNLQNPSVETGLAFQFVDGAGSPTGLVNGPGADLIIFELSPPPGVVPPSGGPVVLGGDPFILIDPATGESVSVFADGFDQFGGNGFSGSTSFFTTAGAPFTSLEELENGDLMFVITVPGLNLYGTAIDLSDLGIEEGASATDLQLQSIAATGFGPDFGFIAGLPGTGGPTGIVDGILTLDAFGSFTADFVLDILSPQGGVPVFSGIKAPLFTSITVDATDLLTKSVTGDFLLDGSAPLTAQATIVADYLTDVIASEPSGAVFDSLLGVSDFALASPANLEPALLQLSPEPQASAPTVIGIEQADLYMRRLSERTTDARREGFERTESQVWYDAFGALGDRDPDTASGKSGFDPDLYGFILGLDYGVTDALMVGVSAAYLSGDASFDTLSTETDSDAGAISMYAMQTFGDFYASATVGYGFGESDTDRDIVSIDGVSTVESSYDVDQFFTSVEVGWATSYFGIDMEPSLETAFVNLDRATFTEAGAPGLALAVVEAPVVNALFIEPELDMFKEIDAFGFGWRPEASIGYRFEVLNEDPSSTAFLIGTPETPSLTVEGLGVSRGAVSLGTGISASLSDQLTLSVEYAGLYDNDFTSHDLSLAARWRF